jgi:ribosomal protein S1
MTVLGEVDSIAVKPYTENEYGFFVRVAPGVSGLLHKSKLSDNRLLNPSELLSTGEKITVQILDIDKASRKVSLGYKDVESNREELKAREKTAIERRMANMSAGRVLQGRVTSILFDNKSDVSENRGIGAIVRLPNGVEGLLHISDCSDKPLTSLFDLFSPGDTLLVEVKAVGPDTGSVHLRLKEAL